MKIQVTVEVESYRDAQYILGAAALLDSSDDYDGAVKGEPGDRPMNIPVASVLLRTVNLASWWLTMGLDDDAADDVLNESDEMKLDVWAAAFRRMRIAEKDFLRLVESDERFREGLKEFNGLMEDTGDA